MAFVLAFLLSSWTFASSEGAGGYEASESVLTIAGGLDVSCILKTWRITGVYACPRFPHGVNVCLVIENAFPVGILETVRRPLTSHLVEMAPLLKGLENLKPGDATASHTPSAREGGDLQFTEAHVYEFVPGVPVLGLPLAIPRGRPFAVSYLSELEGFAWRSGLPDLLLDPGMAARKAALPACSTAPRLDDCVWAWGTAWPRTGFVTHPSEVMAAYLASVRAGKVAAIPLGRVVPSPHPYESRTGHFMQMLRPTWKSCASIGFPWARPIEAGALSKEGAYLLVQFSLFRKCDGCFGATLVEPRPPGP